MSTQTRQWVCDHLQVSDTQRADLMQDDPTASNYTHSELTGLLQAVAQVATGLGCGYQLTAVRSDHDDDSTLGEHCHFNGWCADGYPLKSRTRDDWMDPTDPRFAQIIAAAANSQYLHQVGLGGDADTGPNRAAAGPTYFHDGDEDHVHFGAQTPQ